MSRGKSNTKNWRKNDRQYREQERQRRLVNRRRRAITTEAVARDVSHEQVRSEWAEREAASK